MGLVEISLLFGSNSSSVVRLFFFFSSRRRHTRSDRDWSSDVCSSDLPRGSLAIREQALGPDHPDVAETLGVLGGVLGEHSDFANAYWAQRRAHAVEERRSEERRVGKECRSRWSPDH